MKTWKNKLRKCSTLATNVPEIVCMIKKGRNKFINKISGSSNQYEIQKTLHFAELPIPKESTSVGLCIKKKKPNSFLKQRNGLFFSRNFQVLKLTFYILICDKNIHPAYTVLRIDRISSHEE